MVRRLMHSLPLAALLVAGLLIAGQGVTAAADYSTYNREVRSERSTLDDIRTTLGGLPLPPPPPSRIIPSAGLLSDGKPFRAQFTDVVLSSFDAPRLAAILEDAANMPPDSRFEIRGRIDGDPFLVIIRSERDGRKEARLEGLVFRDRFEAMNLLESLTRHGVQYGRLDGRVGYQHVVGRIDNGVTRFEG